MIKKIFQSQYDLILANLFIKCLKRSSGFQSQYDLILAFNGDGEISCIVNFNLNMI